MVGMRTAIVAKLLELKALGCHLLVLGGAVVTMLALRTLKSNYLSHVSSDSDDK